MEYSERNKKRVLHIYGILNRGGAEIRALEFIKRTQKEDVIYDFLVLTGAKGVLDDDFRKVIQGEIHYIRLDKTFFPKYISLLRRNKYDIVHSHVLLVSGLLLAIAYFLKVPIRIAHLHSTGNNVRSGVRKLRDVILKKMMFKYATNIIAVSGSVMKAIFGNDWVKYPKTKVIYNGFVDYENKYTQINPRLKIGHVGRFDPAKNHPFLAEMYKIICDEHSNVTCYMTGRLDNNIYPAVVNTLKQYCDTGRIIIQSESSNIFDQMKTYDFLITTSLWEGLPGVIIESVALGVPVLASEIEPNKEVATQVRGVTIVEGWDKNEWRKQINEMIERVTASDKAQTIKELQLSFMNSPFYYQNTDNEMLKIYQITGRI